jgi:uncharacterized membrane protein (DUF106 family)
MDLKNQVNITDGVTIIFLALLTNIFSEGISWLFIYKKKKYKECKKNIEVLNKKIEQSKEGLKGKNKVVDKRVKQSENDLKMYNTEMMKVRLNLFTCIDQDDNDNDNWVIRCLFPESI